MLVVMEKYGWDYHTYMNQPSWLLDLARKKMALENKIAAHALKSYAE
jgi:hypothetical protein